MRKTLALLAVFFAVLFSGCGFAVYGPHGEVMSSVGAYTVGGFHAYNNQLTITNASQFPLTVIVNGNRLPNPLSTGESISLELWAGWSNWPASRTATIVVCAHANGRVVVAERTVFVSTWSQYSEAWTIRNGDLR